MAGCASREFYARRARRLLPAAAFVLLVTAVVCVRALPPLRVHAALLDVRAAALYAANYRFAAAGTNYLNADAPPSPVQHYWSLGVEEQFYLIWPALLMLAVLLARRRGRSVLAGDQRCADAGGDGVVRGLVVADARRRAVGVFLPADPSVGAGARRAGGARGALVASAAGAGCRRPLVGRARGSAGFRAPDRSRVTVPGSRGVGARGVDGRGTDRWLRLDGDLVAAAAGCRAAAGVRPDFVLLVSLALAGAHPRPRPRGPSTVPGHGWSCSRRPAALLAYGTTRLLEEPVRFSPLLTGRAGRSLTVGAALSVTVLLATAAVHVPTTAPRGTAQQAPELNVSVRTPHRAATKPLTPVASKLDAASERCRRPQRANPLGTQEPHPRAVRRAQR